jgi:uncharacterized protein (DUF1684 family)
MKIKIVGIFVVLMAVVFISCKENEINSTEKKEYVQSILKERAEKDSSMQFSPYSPFQRDTSITFHPLRYFKPNPEFIFKSKLYTYPNPDTVKIAGTRGEARSVLLIGYVELKKDGKNYKVNIYEGFSQTGEPYYSIWFTDRTTGKETYGVGRYLDFELNPDSNFVYTIDFNKAYNPYCAYSYLYSCPVPREEDYIDMSIEAGEKNFH